jgi:hypothetical protein
MAGVRHAGRVVEFDRFLRFAEERRDGLHAYVIVVPDGVMPVPIWPGLWQPAYPEDPDLNPYHRHAINNSDGEALAVWRALAWALTAGSSRLAIPAYYRDDAAALLGIDRATMSLVRWEYEVDVERNQWSDADHGFVPARACVPVRADPWQLDHAGFAGLFEVTEFRQFTALDRAVGFDTSSQLTLFGIGQPGRTDGLRRALNRANRPYLAEILRPGDLFVDLAVVRDAGIGWTSYLTVKTPQPIDEVSWLADHYRSSFHRYLNHVDQLRTIHEFHTAIEELLAPPNAGAL